MELVDSPFTEIVADLAKNGYKLTPELQNAIALFIGYQTVPMYKIESKLDEKTIAEMLKG